MKLEDFEQLAVDALKNGHYEAAACLYLGLYEIAKLKSVDTPNAGISLTCPFLATNIENNEPPFITYTCQGSKGVNEVEA